MAVLKCKMCGGTLEPNGESTAVCEYCGTRQTLPKTNDEALTNLYNRANNLRLKCEFDRAQGTYEKIVEQDVEQAEAHWGIVLCKYGIEYVEDPRTGKRVPTCHRTLFEAVTADADYEAAVDYADTVQQEIYKSEARAIDRIQKDILAIVKNEKPFDVFLCYKETDFDGKRTQDSVIANEIYHQLTQEGFKVFYAAITLEEKLGQEYEPYIFAALHSARVMLVIGTRPEFFDAVWVRNEWSRFLHLAKDDRRKLLIPCYRDMDPYDLPDEFAHLQAQDMAKIGFINDVVRGIKKVLAADPQKTVVSAPADLSPAPAAAAGVEPLLERTFMFLEDGNWSGAVDYANRVLDLEPKNARAYLALLMFDLRVRRQDDLKNCTRPFDNNSNYQKAVRFADEALRATITGYLKHIHNRDEKARLDRIYRNAKNAMTAAGTENAYKGAARLFDTISEYADSAALAKECLEKAESSRKDAILAEGKAKMAGGHFWDYESALQLFESIPGWKDTDEKAAACRKKLEELNFKEGTAYIRHERQKKMARIGAAEHAGRSRKIAAIAAPIICAVIAFIIVLNAVIIPNGKYNHAIAQMEAGNMDEAYSIFQELGDYKDAIDKAVSINKKQLKNTKAGDYINFGSYEQDNNTSNGKEDIEWLVLEVKDGKALVISKHALDCKPYNDKLESVTWETCSLRKWLNNDFIRAAFSAEEKAMIPTVTVSADRNPVYSTNPGNATQDRVFLLSITEANKYFSTDSARQCKPTKYAVAGGAYVNSDNSNCWWWLRTPGNFPSGAAPVRYDGNVFEDGGLVNYIDIAVRPAFWIDLTA